MPFPAAAQPDIVRASQKDEGYKLQLAELCHDAVRRVVGPRRAILCSGETGLVAGLLYHALTTGCGQQTLGEEYCDLLQVTGAQGREPSVSRRLALALLDAAGPYLAEKVQQTHGIDASRRNLISQCTGEILLKCAATLSPWVLKVHLAIYYLFGAYYEVSKRLTAQAVAGEYAQHIAGTRFIFLGKLFEQRPSYRILGVLMLAQLATNAAIWGLSQPSLALLSSGQGEKSASDQPIGPAVLVEEAEAALPPAAGGESAHRCPLCLSPREHATSTACGHVFCWACISAWANQKPECPLCRSPVLCSDLVRIQHADF